MSNVTRLSIRSAVICAASLALLSACGSGGSGSSASGELHEGMHMSQGMHLADGTQLGSAKPAQTGPQPSESAEMVCSDEIHTAVARTFEQPSVAAGTSTWAEQLFTCTYHLDAGPLVLSVKDSLPGPSGRAYFDALRASDGRPPLLTGLEAFGLPSYETTTGRVVFLKDGKTLVVDAEALPKVAGPKGQSRPDVAYAIAADVIGCWSE